MIEDKSELLKITAKTGESFRIRLWEDRTKGNRWMPSYDATAFRLLSDEYERTRNIRVSDIGMHCFEFIATSSGVFSIEFELRYGWKFSAESHLTYEVSISG